MTTTPSGAAEQPLLVPPSAPRAVGDRFRHRREPTAVRGVGPGSGKPRRPERRKHSCRDEQGCGDRDEDERDLALTGLAAEPASRGSRTPSRALGRSRLGELATRRLGDRAQRRRDRAARGSIAGRRACPEPPPKPNAALDHALRACRARSCRRGSPPPSRAPRPRSGWRSPRVCAPSERKRIDTGLFSSHRLVACASVRVVGRRRRRGGLPFRSGGASVDLPARARPPSAARLRSPCLRRRGTRRSSSTAASTSSWSAVGGVATCASPAKTTSPTRRSVRRLVEERADRLLRGAEPRRLDVLRLHRARRVHDEDHRRALLQEHPLDLRPRERDEERGEPEHEERGRDVAAATSASRDDRREHVEVRVPHGVARAAPLGEEPDPDGRRERRARPSSSHGLWKLIATSRRRRGPGRPRARRRARRHRARARRRSAADRLLAGDARDEARARRRPGEEPERVRRARRAARAAAQRCDDRRASRAHANRLHAPRRSARPGGNALDRRRDARASSRAPACSR